MIARSLPLLVTALLLASPTPARSQLWSPSTGVPVCGDFCNTNYHQVIEDGAGGFYVSWIESRNYPTTDDDAYVQRIAGSGQAAPGWPVEGLSLCSLPRSQSPQAIAPDSEGGVFVTWYDQRSVGPTFGTSTDAYVQRVRSDGVLAPGWPVDGAPASIAMLDQFPEAVVQDGSGGAYVVWRDGRDYPDNNYDIYAQHLTAIGTVAPGWPGDGLAVCTAPEEQVLISALPDGAGGVLIVWEDCRAGNCSSASFSIDIYAQRILPEGTVAPGWTAGGSLLVAGRGFPQVAPDGAGGFYLASSTPADFNLAEHWVERFTMSGTRAAGWPATGLRVCGAPGERHPASIVPDGLGGLLVTWNDFRGPGPAVIFASRVRADGTLAPGWSADGVAVSQILGGQSDNPKVVPDELGGAYVCWEWEDYSGGGNTDAMVEHLTATGAVAPGWPMNGVPVATSLSQHFPRAVTDGSGGVIVVWKERGNYPRAGIFAQRFAAGGPTPVLLALASVDATPERVVLSWQGPGAGSLAASVFRREEASAWERLGAVVRQGDDVLGYEDRAVTAGARFAYRLGYVEDGSEQFTTETWVEVPIGARFALEGLSPNPSAGDPTVAFSLASNGPASLAVFDVHGRLVSVRDVGALGPGAHRVPIGERGRLPAGIYAIRLRQGEFVATARAVVVR